MLKKTVSWAVGYATALIAASMRSQGVDVETGAPTRPNPAAMWPPHRPHPSRPRLRRGRSEHTRMAVQNGRVFIDILPDRLVATKGLRP